MNRLPLLLAFLIASLAHSAVYACSCATDAPPEEFNQAKAIFIGKVLGGTESWEEKNQDGIPHQFEAGNVRVAVEEVFKGDLSGEVIVSVGSMKGTNCGDYGLERHVSYIIYAYGGKDDNVLYDGPYTRTSPANGKYAKEDLDFLRNLPAPGTGGNLQGSIWADLKAGGATPLPNVKVNIRATKPMQTTRRRLTIIERGAVATKDGAHCAIGYRQSLGLGIGSMLETQIGAVGRLAQAVGGEVPRHAFLYSSLLPQERKARGEIEFPTAEEKFPKTA